MCKRDLTEFLAELTEFAVELSEFSLPKQYSRNSIPPVSQVLSCRRRAWDVPCYRFWQKKGTVARPP